MKLRAPIRFLPVILVLSAGASMLVPAWAANDAVAPPAERLTIAGINNFGRVNKHLYRGAQPEPSAYAALKSMGIDTVVKFNSESAPEEKKLVESLGMRFVSLPWSGTGKPSHEQVVTFLGLLHDHPDYNIFVHCEVGADRTGVMVALYRMEFDHWNAAQAVSEMKSFHYHHFFLPHLERYVESFPGVMTSDPDLVRLQPAAPLAATVAAN